VNRGGLYIRDVQFYHAGEYRCIVKSTKDELTVVATLTVIGKCYCRHFYAVVMSVHSYVHTCLRPSVLKVFPIPLKFGV